MTREDFVPVFSKLVRGYGKPFSPEMASAYFDALSDLPLQAVEAAVGSCIREEKYFPAAAEVRERAGAAVRSSPMPASWCSRCSGTGFVDVPPSDDRVEATRVEVARNLAVASSSKGGSKRFPAPVTFEAALAELREREARGEWAPSPPAVVERCSCRVRF